MTRADRKTVDRQGFLHWMLPLMLALIAVTILLSGRDLSQSFADLARGGTSMHPAVPWIQRAVSLALLLISGERLFHHFSLRKPLRAPVLTWGFVAYWAGTVAAPALFGAHPQLSHEYLYALVFGMAALQANETQREQVIGAVRTALFVFLLASAVLAAVQPSLVLDTHYRQGLMPGVPRFGGLATHPVALGMFAQIFLLCLWVRPFASRALNLFAWMLGLGVLFFAQSKTAWVAFLLCAFAMLAVRLGGKVWRRMGDPREAAFGVLMCLVGLILLSAFVALLLFTDVGSAVGDFLETPEGAQLMTATGRDQIWAIALEEWRASPVFGYGLGLWDDAFRASINMPAATNAHNQFMDTLARSGVVGAAALVVYAGLLFVLSLRAAHSTGGLSLALFIALALRSVSEVPLVIFGYGSELFAHLLFIITLASANAPRAVVVRAPQTHRPYRTVA